MKAKPLPDANYLRLMFGYDPMTGRMWLSSNPSKSAGYPKNRKRLYVRVCGREYPLSRVIWKMMTGSEPNGLVDHKNLDSFDDRWTNLREATYGQNRANSNRSANNKSGVKGVCWHKGAWVARIKSQGRTREIGRFQSKEDAGRAYVEQAQIEFGQFARG